MIKTLAVIGLLAWAAMRFKGPLMSLWGKVSSSRTSHLDMEALFHHWHQVYLRAPACCQDKLLDVWTHIVKQKYDPTIPDTDPLTQSLELDKAGPGETQLLKRFSSLDEMVQKVMDRLTALEGGGL